MLKKLKMLTTLKVKSCIHLSFFECTKAYDVSGILQYLPNGRTNVQSESEIELATVPSSIKCCNLIVELLERLDASNPATSLTAYESASEVELSVSNEALLEIVSDSFNSPSESISFALEKSKRIIDELNKAIKKAHLPSIPIRCETLSVKIQKEILLFENGGTRSDFLQRSCNFLMTNK